MTESRAQPQLPGPSHPRPLISVDAGNALREVDSIPRGAVGQAHECPSHDLAGWRKERSPERPRGVVELTPDWVCEIVSPGHERKDALTLFLLLQRHRVPFYWLIWPESRALIAYQLDGEHYRVIATVTEPTRARIPPFDAYEMDLDYVLGE